MGIWRGLFLLGLILTFSGGAVSAFDWRTSKIVASYEGLLCNCVGNAHPYDYQDILRASAGDVFAINFTCKEQVSEVLVAVLSKGTLSEITAHELGNVSLQMFRERIKASAEGWAEGHSSSFESPVDISGSYGLIVVPYTALVGQLGSWQISFKIAIEQFTRNLTITYTGHGTAALGIIVIILVVLVHFVRKGRNERIVFHDG